MLTVGTLTLVTTLGGTYAWAQGAFSSARPELSAVAQKQATSRPSGPSGYGNATPIAEPSASAAPASDVPVPRPKRVRRTVVPAPRAVAPAAVVGDPSPAARVATPATPSPTSAAATFRVATFNMLGSSHTVGGGRGRASGVARMDGAVQLLAQHEVTIAGLQEFQPDQVRAFATKAPGWSAWPASSVGHGAGENSVAWRSDTWTLADKGLIPIPYFHGKIRQMPWVLLQNRGTGARVYVANYHNPADVHGPAQRWRVEATTREAVLFNRLAATGTAVLVTGDMNERASYFCRITGAVPGLHAAAGGSTRWRLRRRPGTPASTGSWAPPRSPSATTTRTARRWSSAPPTTRS